MDKVRIGAGVGLTAHTVNGFMSLMKERGALSEEEFGRITAAIHPGEPIENMERALTEVVNEAERKEGTKV